MRIKDDIASLLADVIKVASSRGLQADVVYVGVEHRRIDYTDGAIENFTHNDEEKIGIRLIKGHQQGFATSNLPFLLTTEKLLDRLEAQLHVLPIDPFCGLAEQSQLYQGFADIDQGDRTELSTHGMLDRAQDLWHGVTSVSGITRSSGASIVAAQLSQALMTSNGFFGVYRDTRFQQSVSAIAGTGTHMEEDYSGDSRLFWHDLITVEQAIDEATQRALRRQNPRTMPNIQGGVIMENRIAHMLISQICQAINAAFRVRGATFLQDGSGVQVANSRLTIRDDPFEYRCFSGAPFDAEGLAKKVNMPIFKGYVQDWISDLSSARALGMASSAQAVRGALSQPPQPGMSHTVVDAAENIDAVLADIEYGMWVTELIGRGLDVINGQYSCGAAGFCIEQGQLTYPCRNVTIAMDARLLLQHLCPADDMRITGSCQIPSLYIEGMTIAGC